MISSLVLSTQDLSTPEKIQTVNDKCNLQLRFVILKCFPTGWPPVAPILFRLPQSLLLHILPIQLCREQPRARDLLRSHLRILLRLRAHPSLLLALPLPLLLHASWGIRYILRCRTHRRAVRCLRHRRLSCCCSSLRSWPVLRILLWKWLGRWVLGCIVALLLLEEEDIGDETGNSD